MRRIDFRDAKTFLGMLLAAFAVVGMLLGTASAQEAGNAGAVSVGTGIDFGTSYLFRGTIQGTEGFIAQACLEVPDPTARVGVWESTRCLTTGYGGCRCR